MKTLERWMRVVGWLYTLKSLALIPSYLFPSPGEASVARHEPVLLAR